MEMKGLAKILGAGVLATVLACGGCDKSRQIQYSPIEIQSSTKTLEEIKPTLIYDEKNQELFTPYNILEINRSNSSERVEYYILEVNGSEKKIRGEDIKKNYGTDKLSEKRNIGTKGRIYTGRPEKKNSESGYGASPIIINLN